MRGELIKYAIQKGIINPAQLLQALERQIDRRVDTFLGMEEGSWMFYEGESTGQWQQMGTRPVEPLVKEALAGRPDWRSRLVSRFCARIGEAPLELSPEAPELMLQTDEHDVEALQRHRLSSAPVRPAM